MSGPKSYSVSVFDVDLKKIFELQCSIQCLVEELRKCQVSDKDRGIVFDCHSFIKSNQDRINKLLEPFTITQKGTISQTQYDTYRQLIRERISQLQSLLDDLEKEREDFLAKQRDYNAFISYEDQFEHMVVAFQDFKTQVIQYLSHYVQQDFPSLYEQAEKAIENIHLKLERACFDFGFRNLKDEMIARIENEIKQCRGQIDKIRAELSNKVMEEAGENHVVGGHVTNALNIAGSEGSSQEVQEKIEKIREFISGVRDATRRQNYLERLNALMNSKSFKDEYYYTELLEDLKQEERGHVWKARIYDAIARLNQIEIHEKMQVAKTRFITRALELMEKSRIKPYEYEDLQARLKLFEQDNEQAIREELVKEREREFIRAQLVQSLKDLNYEVMSDMEVIDFERQSDFLFKIPRQKNYLNLRFHPDGSLLYSFVIPENKESLSIDQKRRKMTEMETTCNEFKHLLKELTSIGLKIDLEKEMSISERALIQVPGKYRSFMQAKAEQVVVREKERKRYLNK